MKNISRILLLTAMLSAILYSCQKASTLSNNSTAQVSKDKLTLSRETGLPIHDICIADADTVIMHYRYHTGITDSTQIDNMLTYEAPSVREYLSDPSITKFHVILGYQDGHMTAVLVGTDGNNRVVLNQRNMLLEHSDQWCPMCKCCALAFTPYGTIKNN